MLSSHAVKRLVAFTSILLGFAACAPRARLCTATSECAAGNACVAGRCQLEKPTVKPAVDSARRIVVRPVDMAVVASGDRASKGALPPIFALGRDSAKLFLRFSVALPVNANVIEAYVVLRRSPIVDDDPAPISLHATRIEEAWSGGSVSWAMQPRMSETRTPSTLVEPSGTPLVRMDVREIVKHWAKHDPHDQGVAIVAENDTRTGTTFAISGGGADRDVEPYLELYVR